MRRSIVILQRQTANHNFISSLIVLFAHIFFILFPIKLFFLFRYQSIVLQSLLFFLLLIWIGTRMRALGNIMHECSHYSFAPTKRQNRWIGHFIAILDLSSFHFYQINHHKHHRFLGIKDKDPDYNKYLLISKRKKQHLFFILFNPLHWLSYLKEDIRLKDKNYGLIFIKIIYLIFLILFIKNYFILTLCAAYVSTYQMMKILSDFLDHHRNYEENDGFLRTQNHAFKKGILNLIFFPRNDAYHLVHHIQPLAPVTKLKMIHKNLLRENKEYRQRSHTI